MNTNLYRSRTDAVLGGVCAGLAQYLAIDVVLVRLFFVLLTLASGPGVLIYLVLWIVLPQAAAPAGQATLQSRAGELAGQVGAAFGGADPRAGRTIGAALLLLGGFFLLQQLDPVSMRWFDGDLFWPLLLILGGVVLIWRRAKGATL